MYHRSHSFALGLGEDDSGIIITKYFLYTGEVDVNTSFPLSRFMKGKSQIKVPFAVEGAYSESWVCALFIGMSL